MKSKKPRVMAVGEWSGLGTGYGSYSREVLKRLHASGKYELLEYASYLRPGQEASVPWRVESAVPETDEEKREFDKAEGGQLAQFGSWKWERAALAFRPTAVTAIRDPWMDEFLVTSPFRPFYGLAMMPTVDAVPQRDDWLAQFAGADALLSYTDWGAEVLRQQSAGTFNVLGSAPAGVDGNVFRPPGDKRGHKEAHGLDPDCLILGMTARNQRRKLFPDLARDFALLLGEMPDSLARKCYLYWHTGWPDLGWDMPRLLREYGLSSRVLFTYRCRQCAAYWPAFFCDTVTVCRGCGKRAATFPTTEHGVTKEQLAGIYGLFDGYVQYCNSEGFGIPLAEAAACGVPSLAVDYSAMGDVARKVGGIPLPPSSLTTEPETGCLRAVPDTPSFVREARKLLCLPAPVRASMGARTRRMALQAFNWDRTAGAWMMAIDSVRPALSWEAPPRFHEAPKELPNLPPEEFVRWGMAYLAGRPELASSYTALRMARDLAWDATLGDGLGGHYMNDACMLGSQERLRPYTKGEAANRMHAMGEKKNRWEKARAEANR